MPLAREDAERVEFEAISAARDPAQSETESPWPNDRAMSRAYAIAFREARGRIARTEKMLAWANKD